MKPGHSSKQAFALAFVCVLLIAPRDAAPDDPIDFQTEIVPVLTRHGCNAGSCHGSAAGRGGFKLSLYGSQPRDDFRAIVQEGKGRRINRQKASRSLLLRKPAGGLEHGGGFRFDIDDEAWTRINNWIKQGANFSNDVHLEQFDIGPSLLVFEKSEARHPFKFTAKYSDGTSEDVTPWTILTTNDETGVKINHAKNTALIQRPGRHIVIARFLDQVRAIEILVPFPQKSIEKSATNELIDGQESFVDELINKKLAQLNLPTGERTSDDAFLRRISLDLTGRLPTAEQIKEFAADKSPRKRKLWIDRFLSSDAFAEYWTYRFATQLRIRSQPRDKKGAQVYHQWLKKQITQNRPWDEIVRSLILASGDSHQIGPASFYRTTSDARLQSEFVTEALLGVKLRCANCHDHPLDRWTQDDYHGLAAVFAKVKQSRVVSLNPQGENIHAKTGKPAKPRVPGEFFIEDAIDVRQPLAEWMVDKANPFFARSVVNRLWQGLMGRGLVEPVDDLRSTNPATHPILLKHLADDFAKNGFDLRRTIRLICNSDAYQRAIGSAETPTRQRDFYANALVRDLPPEVLADSISDVTGVFETYPGHPPQTRAIQLFDSRIPSRSLDILGRCSREESCDTNAQAATGGLATQLHLLNGELVNGKILTEGSNLRRLLQEKKSNGAIVRFFYVKAFSRSPTAAESEFWENRLHSDSLDDRIARLEDFVWSILNSREFKTNH